MSNLYFEPKGDFFMQTKQSLDTGFIIYEIRMARALLEDVPDVRGFEGLFNSLIGLSLVRPDSTVEDCVILQPEALSMQLMRLAYVAAHHEEGAYGADESEELS
jgi:hypothetical protein